MAYRIWRIIRGTYILRKTSLKDFCGLIFADHQVEYIVSLSHCFLLRIKISHSVSLQNFTSFKNFRIMSNVSVIASYIIYYGAHLLEHIAGRSDRISVQRPKDNLILHWLQILTPNPHLPV